MASTITPDVRPPGLQRLPGLERLRIAATLAVVLLHAAIAYMPHPLPRLVWATHDAVTPAADAVGWIANSFVMPFFFVLGGFGAAGLLQRHGPRETARHRIRRLGGPLLLGCVLILPLDLYAWLLGFAADGLIPLKKLRSLKLGSAGEGLWGPSHLWFLQYLLVYSLCLCGLRAAGWRMPAAVRRMAVTPLGVLAMACLTAAPLAMEPAILIGFRHSWWPLPLTLSFYGPMFAFGVWLATPDDSLRIDDHRGRGLAAFGWPHAVVGLLALAAAWPLLKGHVEGGLASGPRVAMTWLYTAAGWLIAVGAIGAASRDCRPLSPRAAYLASACFWVYLFHHPVVGCAQVALKPLSWPADVKFAVTAVYGVGLSLLMFEACVRRTWVGGVLGVRRRQPAPQTEHRRAA